MNIWVDELLHEYGIGKKQLERMRDELDRKNERDRDDLTQINSMIESMSYSMDWMSTGRQPDTYRGVDIRNVYQKRILESMDIIPDIMEQLEEGPKQLYMTREEKLILADIFAAFSLRERQCFVMHYGGGLSWGTIAKELGVSRSMVQQSIRRAKKKVAERIDKNKS